MGLGLTGAVGLSVVILGWHYSSDVLGAFLVVGTWGFCALAYLRQRREREVEISARRPERRGRLAVSTD